MKGRGEGGTASSLTDLMASLVAVFVLLFVAAQNNRGAGMKNARDALLRSLEGRLAQAGIEQWAVDSVPNDPSTVIIVLPDSVLFDRGSDIMKPAGRTEVERATPILAGVICDPTMSGQLDQLVVEGHTDNTIRVGLSPQDGRMYNLALSQRRSMHFVQTSTAALKNDEELLGCYLQLVSATGRGQEDLLPSVPGDAAQQRRVLLRIRLRTDLADTVRVTTDGLNP
jgi:outer membrane protein OmpA-like peptidoglycan-associated protein